MPSFSASVMDLDRLLGVSVLEEGPGQSVVAVDILALLQVLPRELQRPRQVAVMVGVEEGEHAAVLGLTRGRALHPVAVRPRTGDIAGQVV